MCKVTTAARRSLSASPALRPHCVWQMACLGTPFESQQKGREIMSIPRPGSDIHPRLLNAQYQATERCILGKRKEELLIDNAAAQP